jgi:DNA-binding NtrC family response regulator
MQDEKEAVVLIVHSGGQLRDLLSRVLESDFACVTASGVREAKEILSGVSCAIAVTILPMADEDGVELSSFIHESYPETVVIGLTGERISHPSHYGLFDCLREPLEITQVRAAVRRGVAYRNCRRRMEC